MSKGKLIHCNGIVGCTEPEEKGYVGENSIDAESFRNIFFKDYGLGYVLDLSLQKGIHFHITTHSVRTSTCKDKARITGLPLERIIKGTYLEDASTEKIYGLFTPGIKNAADIRLKLGGYLSIDSSEIIEYNRITKARKEFLDLLGIGIEFGTVHPFLNEECFMPKGIVETIFFDKDFLEKRKAEGGLDDFSFTTHPSTGYDNHRLSIQINYANAFEILKEKFSDRIKAIELV